MRKFLLGSTALVTAAALGGQAAASVGEKIELELRGYAQFGLAGIVDEPEHFGGNPDFFSGNSVVFGSDSEVHFRGMTTLDNGLQIGFRAELELEDDTEVDDVADIIDEVYAQIAGGFGRFQFGMQDGAPDQMIISAPNVFAQFTISSLDMNPFEMYTAADLATRTRTVLGLSGDEAVLDTSPDFTEDFTKIIYFTPRIFGVQLGASYTPNPCRNDTGLDVATSAASDSDPDFSASCGADRVFGSNYWEVAGNYSQEFSGFGLGVSASYGRGDANPFVGILSEGPTEWHAGGEVFFELGGGRLTLGGAYKETDNLTAENKASILAQSHHYDAGAKYSIGPWEIGGTYGRARSDDGASNDELTIIIGGASYKLGPGVKMGVGVIHGDAKEGTFSTEIDEAKGTAVFSELDLRF